MKLDGWAGFTPQAPSLIRGPNRKLDTTPALEGAEQVFVFARRHNEEAEWRAALSGAAPRYEAADNSAGYIHCPNQVP